MNELRNNEVVQKCLFVLGYLQIESIPSFAPPKPSPRVGQEGGMLSGCKFLLKVKILIR